MNSKYKKDLGRWGEESIDTWMYSQGYEIYKKNLKLKRGEIDRVYQYFEEEQATINFCVSEIKTIVCKSKARFFQFFTELGLRTIVRNHQIQNLYKFSENLIAKNIRVNHIQKKVYVRLFMVLKVYDGYDREEFFINQTTFKVCYQKSNVLILSLRF